LSCSALIKDLKKEKIHNSTLFLGRIRLAMWVKEYIRATIETSPSWTDASRLNALLQWSQEL
jgi:hypothetical protein